MKKIVTQDCVSTQSFKKNLVDSLSQSKKHALAISSLCVGNTPVQMRNSVNITIRSAVANHHSPFTSRKSHVLRCLDIDAPIDEWMIDFRSSVVPFIIEKLDPSLLK